MDKKNKNKQFVISKCTNRDLTADNEIEEP